MATRIHDEDHHIRLCAAIIDAHRIAGRRLAIAELRTRAPESPVTRDIVKEHKREINAILSRYRVAKL